jgi:hypothetical protein
MRATTLAFFLVACGSSGQNSPDPVPADGVAPTCAAGETYPPAAPAVMTLGEVIPPFRWPEAIDRATGQMFAFDLSKVPCNVDPNLDWSPADVLVFVSIPAW